MFTWCSYFSALFFLFWPLKLDTQYYLTSLTGKKFSGRPMCTLLTNKRYELLYNCGIQLLHIGRPLAAFECLIEAVQVYHSNPRLWLRLAECCIAANKGVSKSALEAVLSHKTKTGSKNQCRFKKKKYFLSCTVHVTGLLLQYLVMQIIILWIYIRFF